MTESKIQQLKAALLLSRIVVANMEEIEFRVAPDELLVTTNGTMVEYEGVQIRVLDMLGGALLILRGLTLDLAESEELHPAEVARVVELTAAMSDAIGFPERW